MPALNKNITVRLRADASNFNASIKAAGANAQQLADGMEQSGRKTSLLTTGLAAAGMAAGALGVAAIKTASDFDASMSGVQSATRASASEMDLLRQAAIQAGADTIYGATDAAGAIEELGKAGLSTADILSGGLSGALDLAASDGMEVADAAGYMSTALTQFNLSGSDATHVADLLAAGAGKALGSVSDMGEALNNSGQVAHSFGMSLEETVGTLAAFASQGKIGAEGGTLLSSVINNLTGQTEKQKQAMEEYGITLHDQQGNFVGMASLAGQLHDKLSGLTAEQRNAALAAMFDTYARQGALALYQEGAEGIEEWTKAVDDSGYASEMAAARTDNLKGDLEQLSGSVETLLINLGEGGQGPLRSLVQTLDMLVDAFSGLPEPVQQWLVLGSSAIGIGAALHKSMGPLSDSTSAAARSFSLFADPWQRLTGLAGGLQTAFHQIQLSMMTASQQMDAVGTASSKTELRLGALKSIGGGLLSFLGGPWGIAFSAAGSAVMYLAKQQQEAQQRTESYEQAIRATGDATQQMVEDLTSRGIGSDIPILDWFQETSVGAKTFTELLDDVGIELSTFVSAAKGDADALDEVNGVIDELSKGHGQAASQAATLQRALDEESDAFAKAKSNAALQDETMKQLNESSDEAAGSALTNADANGQLADSSEDAADAIGDLIDNLFELEGVHVSAYEAQTQLQDSIQSLTDSLAENGNTLDINTEQGRANRDALSSLASQAMDTAQAILEEGAQMDASGQTTDGLTNATEQARASLENARTAFVNAAVAAGMTQADAEALATQFGLTGGKADELAQSINAIPDKNVTVTANTSQAESSIMRLVNGNWSTTIRVRASDDGASLTIGRLKASAMADGGLVGYADGGLMADKPLMRLASGDGYTGLINGWGGKKADVVPIMASRGEFMQQASAVDYYGVDAMRALNERKIPREWLAGPQMVNGGSVDNRSYNVTLQVVGTPDPEVTARKTFEIFQREVRRLS